MSSTKKQFILVWADTGLPVERKRITPPSVVEPPKAYTKEEQSIVDDFKSQVLSGLAYAHEITLIGTSDIAATESMSKFFDAQGNRVNGEYEELVEEFNALIKAKGRKQEQDHWHWEEDADIYWYTWKEDLGLSEDETTTRFTRRETKAMVNVLVKEVKWARDSLAKLKKMMC